MRVLALTSLYPNPFQPHKAVFNRHQFRLLNARHAVRVIAPISWTDELRARAGGAAGLPKGRRADRDGLVVHHPRYLFPPKAARGWYGHCFQASVADAFRRAMDEFRPDLVFAPWAYPDGWAAVRLARAAGLPVVIQCHGSDVLLLAKHPAKRRRTVEAVTAADGVVAVSHDIAARLRELGVSADRIRVIHDGVDQAQFHPGSKHAARTALSLPPSEQLLLFVGNLLPVKGLDVLLNALVRLPAVTLLVVGHGPLRPALEAQAAKLGLADRVRFIGPVPHDQLPDWYRAADVFVLPSRSEGVPNVLLEASACGVPWVASRVGGISEIAHLGASRLTPPEDPTALAAAIQDFLTAPHPVSYTQPKARETAVEELSDFLHTVSGNQSAGPMPPASLT